MTDQTPTTTEKMLRIIFMIWICNLTFTVADLHLRKVYPCEANPGFDMNLTCTINEIQGQQRMDCDYTLNKPYGDDQQLTLKFQVPSEDGTFITMFVLREKLCDAFKKYFGQFGTDLLIASQLPASCPIPKGSHHIRNFLIDFSKMPFKTFPNGQMLVELTFRDVETNKISSCIIFDVFFEQ